MSTISDKQVMDNTTILPQDDGSVVMRMVLPDNEVFEQKAQNADNAKKYFIPFCDSVRAFWADKQRLKEESRMEEHTARKEEDAVRPPESLEDETSPIKHYAPTDTKGMVIEHYRGLQQQIDALGDQIEEMREVRNEFRDERDTLTPVMEAWGITEGK